MSYCMQAHAAILVKNHGKKHHLLRSMKRFLTKRPFTDEECKKIIEVGKTFVGQEKDPINKNERVSKMDRGDFDV